jgi:hypothetical protein
VRVELAGTRLLGRGVSPLLTEHSRLAVARIVEEQLAGDRSHALIAAMIAGALDVDEAYEKALREFEMFGAAFLTSQEPEMRVGRPDAAWSPDS